jgi:ubiquinone/menaquinone biosynthesis C-methylase UbiE
MAATDDRWRRYWDTDRDRLQPAMLDIDRRRVGGVGAAADLGEADAQALPFAGDAFDAVVCTFSLCAIPGHRRAIAEMRRVLRPGGLLLLADHVAGSARPTRAVQRLLEVVTVPLQGEHFLRRPLDQVKDLGFAVERRDCFRLGLVERIAARR